ncbi:DNA primase [Roseivirga sp. UBA1976]|uniref:DNA primase n=1 Tax=Roseivirga sp. UBA1976 TaxID=1947386 RepID=UPI00257EE728|nr:DNA primase [Roseivirga sp. UBA1976]|tara:strand:- start:193 stop:2106 length:1914 start_codon:yes stop_codon:yes gene_type:complete
MAISESTIQEIKNRIDIVDVISDFVSLKKVGSNYRALSPFTNEKTPSFYVSPSKEIFKCFSSGKGGDAITFVMEVEGINYIEALKYLAAKYGIEVQEEEQTDEQIQAQNERDSLFIVLNFANEYFKKQLFDSDEGRSIGLSYFKERGFNEQTLKTFELGYSLDVWDGLLKEAKKKGHSEELLEKAGLILKQESKIYDRFRGRVMFPIQNVAGKVIAFGARTLRSDKKQPKYINSPETEVYHKSKILYGIHQSRQAIRNEDLCYLVEGYTDVISMHQAGVQNVVASSGTSLTKEQVQLISRYTKNITVLYDGDSAGIKASFRGIDMILEHDLNVRAVVFPNGEDPDSFSRSMTSDAFREYLETNARDFITFKTDILTDGGKQTDPVKKVQVIREIIESISLIPDGIKRSVYISACADLLDVEEQVLLSELNKLLIKKQRKDRAQPEPPEPEDLPLTEAKQPKPNLQSLAYPVERECLRLVVNYGNEPFDEEMTIAEFILGETQTINFENKSIEETLNLAAQVVDEGKKIEPDIFIGPENPTMSQLVIDLLEMKYFVSEGWEKKHRISTMHESEDLPSAAYTAILRLKRKKLESLILQNEETLKKSKSVEEQEELMTMHKHLKMMLKEIDDELGIVISS